MIRQIRRWYGRVRRRVLRQTAEHARYAWLAPIDTPRLVRIPELRSVPRPDGASPRLSVLLPALQADRLTGGPNTAINLASRLIADGLRVRLVSAVEPADRDLARVREQIASLSESPGAAAAVELHDAIAAGLPLESKEVVLATWWPTAHIARAALPVTGASEFVYLIQDYEPGFFSWSTNFVLAEATYGFPHRAIFNESLLERWFLGRRPSGLGPHITFEPAVDRGRFFPSEDSRPGKSRLLFYARPQAERNAFELGLAALRRAAASGAFPADRWTAASVGAALPDLALSPGLTMTNLPWLGLDAWAAELRRTSVLLSLMISPHTSYPPLEMAACGGQVVTNTFESKTAEVLAAISPRILGVPPEPEALASALIAAAGRAEGARMAGSPGGTGMARSPEGATTDVLSLPGSWTEAFRDVVPWLAASVRELGGPG